jgi:hypothetical protein
LKSGIELARPIHQVAASSGSGNGARLERLDMEGRRQWQERGVELRQFREQRLRQEVQASSWHQSGSGAGAGINPAQTRARPLSLPPSPVAAHLHGPEVQALARPEHHTTQPGGTTPAGGPRYERPNGQLARPGPHFASPAITDRPHGAQAGMQPIPHHPGVTAPQAGDHPIPSGLAPHQDLGRVQGNLSAPMIPRHETSPRSESPRLHAPPQYIHRQPPPPPRPVPRHEHQPGHHNP